jgi:acyl-CoA synthetase (AMP-forming)/AMP-acid ligase II
MKSHFAERGDRLNLFYVLEAHALDPKTANNQFIVYNGQTTTFHEAYIMVLRYGAWFKNVHGIKRKEIVAMDFMNSSTFVFMLMGLWSIGAVPAFINYNLSGKPLTHSIRTSTARLLVVDEEVRHCFPAEQEQILTSPTFRDGKGPVEIIYHTPEVEAQVLGMEPTREDDAVRSGLIPRDMAILIYTSGTTGLPKPAIVSWKKCWFGSVFIQDWMGVTPSDRFFTASSTDTLDFCSPRLTYWLVHASLPQLRFGAWFRHLFDEWSDLDHWSPILCA